MPDKDPENIKWLIGILAGFATTLWGVLTYRVFDVQKSLAKKGEISSINDLRLETKDDFRHHEKKFMDALKSLADDLKKEIQSLRKERKKD